MVESGVRHGKGVTRPVRMAQSGVPRYLLSVPGMSSCVAYREEQEIVRDQEAGPSLVFLASSKNIFGTALPD